MPIRNSAKAIIMNGEKVLLTKNHDDEQAFFYLFPGGGQEHGETLHDALVRECIEETGQQIIMGELLHIREYLGKNHEHSAFDFQAHQVEFYFICKLATDFNPHSIPTNPDSYQIGMEWVHIKDLMQYTIYPIELRKYIVKHFNKEKAPIYLGDIN